MAEPIKSALFVDYDSLHRGLSEVDGKAAARLAERAAAWVAAIEAGDLVSPPGKARDVSLRRCYADPAVLGDDGEVLIDAGFEVVECPDQKGKADANSVGLQMAIDVAAAAAAASHDEFILLSQGDLSTLIGHLKAKNLSAAIYANESTAKGTRKSADGIVEEKALIAILAADEAPPAPKTPPAPPVDRAAVEAFARKVHAATNVPLFSPKAFGDLFRHLTEEIAENGYHFQSTAENVVARMTEAGRTVTRRQVVFVVKGLALKGHVFSTGDTPERLAEVFREQVLYLANNAGIVVGDSEARLLSAWVCGRTTAVDGAPRKDDLVAVRENTDRPKHKAAAKPEPEADAKAKPEPSAVAEPKAKAEAEPEASPESKAGEEAPEKPSAPLEKETAETEAKADKPAAKPDTQPEAPEGGKTDDKRSVAADRRAAIAARIAAAAKPLLRPGAKASTPRSAPKSEAEKSPPKSSPSPNDALIESSILAAIAEAVDVLVEDSGSADQPKRAEAAAAKKSGSRSQATAPDKRSPAVEERPDPVPSDGGDSDDIGDEIQRIIASYNRNRKKGEAG